MELLEGSLQPYAWGDPEFIARLQGRVPSGRPEAELWFGAHPVAPSRLVPSGRSLLAAVEADPDRWLGPAHRHRFDRFPFLLKVLAAAEPLSIQAHPSRAQARAGFAREEAAGVPWADARRMYRDDNHKPELLVALTHFEAKCGFRSLAGTRDLIDRLASAGADRQGAELARRLDPGAGPGDEAAVLASALSWLLDGSGPARSELVAEVVAASGELLAGGPGAVGPFGPDLRWTPLIEQFHPGDIGVVVALLLNHVVLEPGQGVFLEAGNLHAYLAGAGVEVMANGDNVIRGGLTAKHVDGRELADVVDTSPAPVPIQSAGGSCHRFAVAAPDFSLTRLTGPVSVGIDPTGPEIVLVTAGRAELRGGTGDEALVVGSGAAAAVAGTEGPYRIELGEGGMAWRAAAGDAPAPYPAT